MPFFWMALSETALTPDRSGFAPTLPVTESPLMLIPASWRALTIGTSTLSCSRLVIPASSRIGVTCVRILDARRVRPRLSVKAVLPVSVRSADWAAPRPGNWAAPSVSALKSTPSGSSAPARRPGVPSP